MPNRISRTRLDRFLRKKLGTKKNDVKQLIAQKRVLINGSHAQDASQPVDHFSLIEVDNQIVQNNQAFYVMINKPKGVVSATIDDRHQTAIDLIDYSFKAELHIVGRLDLNSTGLLLLTNDSTWSRRLSLPEKKVIKRYRVTVEKPIDALCIEAFSKGIYFPFEDITTKPVELQHISPCCAILSLSEGRYHQIKRMFGRFRNPVLELHRLSIGNLSLDNQLSLGESRLLTSNEISDI